MQSNYYAMLFRMKYINRWALMRNTRNESLSEHSLETAFIAHCLATIENKRFSGRVNPDRAAVLAMFHDTHEVVTGDLPTPVKYYNPEIKGAYKDLENAAEKRLLSMLPDDLRDEFDVIYNEDDPLLCSIVRAADKISALIKCTDELRLGNDEFKAAAKSTEKAIKALDLNCANVFLKEFMPAFSLSLDEL